MLQIVGQISEKETQISELKAQVDNYKMKEIVDRNEITKREVWERNKAISHFKEKGETYKAELIEAIPMIIISMVCRKLTNMKS